MPVIQRRQLGKAYEAAGRKLVGRSLKISQLAYIEDKKIEGER
jgi:hypothetical protein